MIDKLNLDLFTEVINWEEMRDFQLSYFKSSLSNIDVPQDHAFVSTLYNFSHKHKIKYILNGGNIFKVVMRSYKRIILKHGCGVSASHSKFRIVFTTIYSYGGK